ncbi:MAG: Do family serine endopeptidase [Bacteroidota bacterium]
MKNIAIIILSAMLGSAFTMGLFKIFDPADKQIVQVEHRSSLPVVQSSYSTDAPALDFTEAAAMVMPGVVHIKSTLVRGSNKQQQQLQIPDAFREFFGDQFSSPFQQPRSPQPRVGTGSGVILTADGYIVTNNHVIEGADDIEVALDDNRTFKAEIVGTDPSTDLALIKIEAEGLISVPIGNSEQVKVGQWVLAIGNPLNLTSTVTAGIISAKARNINILQDRAAIESFIQTDAAVNPGNSGGALVDLQGNLVGINTAIASPTGSYSGYSFAVPSRLVRKVVEDLMEHGVVQRGYLGVIIRNVDANLAEEKGLKLTEGVFVDSLLDNSAALSAGIQKGDVITAVNGTTINTSSELQAAIGTGRPGDQVALQVNRKGSIREIPVVLKNRNGNTQIVERRSKDLQAKLGWELEDLSKEQLEKLGIDQGVKVKELLAGEIRQQTKMREGFVITHLNGEAVNNVESLEDMLAERNGGVMVEGVYDGYPGSQYYAFGLK